MAAPKFTVSNSNSGLGLFLFLSIWLVFGRGFENRPSSFEHWLNARYGYQAPNANWLVSEKAAPADPPHQPTAAEVEPEGQGIVVRAVVGGAAIDPKATNRRAIDQHPPSNDADTTVSAEAEAP